MTVADRVRDVVLPLLTERDLDLDVLADATRAVSRALDEADPIAGAYTLEVSSPGLERPLRTPAHFVGAVGTSVKVKTRPGVEGDRRLDGEIIAADDTSVTVRASDGADRTLPYDDIERARTTFEWGAPEKPTTKKKTKANTP